MTADDIREYLDWYERNFEYIFSHHEGYKWKAMKVFQDKAVGYNGRPTDYLYDALSASGNLLNNRYAFSRGMLKDFIDFNNLHPDVKTSAIDAFNDLLATGEIEGVETRIRTFIAACKLALKEYWNGEKKNTFQDTHAASVYLAFMYPETFYIYRAGEFERFNKLVLNDEYDYTWGSVENYTAYIRMCDQIREILKNEAAERTSFANSLKLFQSSDEYFNDPSFNLLTQDFIYSVVSYYREEFTVKPVKRVSDAVFSEPVNASAIINVSKAVSYDPDVKSVQRVDYVAKQRVNSKIGNAGEEWVKKVYEPQRLRWAGMQISDSRIKWVSKISDAYGYDIQSFDPDGKTIYIEVKTTNGPLGSEFYISEYELAASRYYGDRYRLYRVYDFEKDPKVVIVKGCLDALIPVAKTYSIKLSKDLAHDD